MEGDTADGASSGGPQPASPSVVAAAPAAETTPSEGDVVFDVRGERFTVAWSKLQAYPGSLLTDLATAAAEQAGVMTGPITLDRDPTLFSHVLRLLDKPAFLELEVHGAVRGRVVGTPWVDERVATEAAFARAFDEELDFYGIVPCATLLPALCVTARRERLLELSAPVVSSIISQIARLVQSSCEEFSERVTSPSGMWMVPQLTFFLSDPDGTSWSEASVRVVDDTDQAGLREIYQIVLSYDNGTLHRASGGFFQQFVRGLDKRVSELTQVASQIRGQQREHPRFCPFHVQAALRTRLESMGYKALFSPGAFLELYWPPCGASCHGGERGARIGCDLGGV